MFKYKNRVYRIITKNELDLRTYVYHFDENNEYNMYLADMEYVAVKKIS